MSADPPGSGRPLNLSFTVLVRRIDEVNPDWSKGAIMPDGCLR